MYDPERVIPDSVTVVPITGGELRLHPAYDVVHRFEWLGFNILKYWNQEAGGVSNIAIDDQAAVFLHADVGIEVLQRRKISAHEYVIYQDWVASKLDEIFGGDFDGEISDEGLGEEGAVQDGDAEGHPGGETEV